VLRREIELLKHPPGGEPEPEKEEEVMDVTEPVVEEGTVEEVNGVENGVAQVEEAKVEETEAPKEEEEEMSDEDGLFSSEFDNLMDPSGFHDDMGFGENMDWINDV
jgi:hypothetical protein